ncbi:hypothetical protein DUE52_17135 [Larkinella punicea]|uniref:Uncharacterized protein n=1 Tax=Larkinella punicea TaxID=2315727 RepID=A0A368JN55_9BACT|nr:hypothetical protein DUE52_17135 [Larkinella punicea]
MPAPDWVQRDKIMLLGEIIPIDKFYIYIGKIYYGICPVDSKEAASGSEDFFTAKWRTKRVTSLLLPVERYSQFVV